MNQPLSNQEREALREISETIEVYEDFVTSTRLDLEVTPEEEEEFKALSTKP